MPSKVKTGRIKSQIIAPKSQLKLRTAKDYPIPFSAQLAKKTVEVFNAALRNQVRKSEVLNDRKDRTDARNVNNQFDQWERDYRINLRNRRGENAKGVYDDYQKASNEKWKELTTGLNENSKWYADAKFSASYDTGSNNMFVFEEKELIRYDRDTRDAQNQIAIDSARTNFKSPKSVLEAEQLITKNINEVAKMEGSGQEVADNRNRIAIDTLHSAVLREHLRDNPKNALHYLEANKDKFEAATYEKKHEEVEKLAKKQEIKDTVIQNSLLPLSEQMDIISKKFEDDPESRVKANKMAKDLYLDRENTKQLDMKKKLESAADDIRNDPINYKIDYSAWDVKHQDYLDNLQRKLKQDEMAKKGIGSPSNTNPKIYNALTNMSYEEFQAADLTDPRYVNGLKSEHLYKFMDLKKKQREEHFNVQSRTKYVNDLVDAQTDNADQANKMREYFEYELNKYPADQRNKIETWNRDKDLMLLEVDVKGTVFDKKYWEARTSGDKILEPEEKPDKVPEGAQWIDKTINGKPIRGWKHTNSAGVTFLYTFDGIYRVD